MTEFNKDDLTIIYDSIVSTVEKSIQETNENLTPKHVIYSSHIKYIEPEIFNLLEKDQYVISCAFAGTNWITSLYKNHYSNELKLLESYTMKIPKNSRQCTYIEFIEKMKELIFELKSNPIILKAKTIGISFGFPHRTTKTNSGIDAVLETGKLPKFWSITDFEENKNKLIGASLLEELKKEEQFINLTNIYILNDTNSVSHYIENKEDSSRIKLPAGFVFGTGVNAAYKEWNLEIGKHLLPKEVTGNSYTQYNEPIFEHWIGGAYLIDRFVYEISCTDIKSDTIEIIKKEVTVSKDISELIIKESKFHFMNKLSKKERILVITSAKDVLKKAAQLAGVLISSIIKISSIQDKPFYIPIEGSVFWQAYKFKEHTSMTINQFYPNLDYTFVKASGIIGIAQASLVLANQ